MSAADPTSFDAVIRAAVRDIMMTEVLPAVREAITSVALPREAAPVASGPPCDPDDAWDVKRVAKHHGVSPSLVRKWERLGILKALPRTSKRLLFDPAVVRSFRVSGLSNVVPMKRSRR